MKVVLDTGYFLACLPIPPGAMTGNGVVGEVKPGGRVSRHLEMAIAAGLRVLGAAPEHIVHVRSVALEAGTDSRLSATDVEVLALALEYNARLLSEDYTVLDIAKRLQIKAEPITTKGIEETKDMVFRCLGCGKFYDEAPKKMECRTCGHEVKAKPKR